MIVIVAYSNIYCAPYINIYKSILDKSKLDYEVFYLNRDNIDEESKNVTGFKYFKLKGPQKVEKLYNTIRYVSYIKSVLLRKDYDGVIMLTTIPSVFLFRFLNKHYYKRYFIDVRDFTLENNALFRWIEKIVFSNAKRVIISSAEFKQFLPKNEYVISHNTLLNSLAQKDKYRCDINRKGVITIGYLGFISYPETCIALIDLVAKDPRFKFVFYGHEYGRTVIDYVSKINANNVYMMGKYKPEEKGEICDKIDILFNAYGNSSQLLRCALSNKYYDAIIHKKPILNSPNTYMGIKLAPISYTFDHVKETSLDHLYEWYIQLNEKVVNDFCCEKCDEVYSETLIFQNVMERDLNDIVSSVQSKNGTKGIRL